jgi:hypothetical protein
VLAAIRVVSANRVAIHAMTSIEIRRNLKQPSMNQVLHSPDEVKEMIARGELLVLAGDETLLRQLPTGRWIAGTTPYFIAEAGGVSTRDKIHVTVLPEFIESAAIQVYEEAHLDRIHRDIPQNGFAFIVIPAASPVHRSFGLNAPVSLDFAARPLIGWVSGVHLDDLGKASPKVFDGRDVRVLENHAVVLHIQLPANKKAGLGVLNIFEQGGGDTITFTENGFTVTDAYIDGEKRNLADYIAQQLVAETAFGGRLPWHLGQHQLPSH